MYNVIVKIKKGASQKEYKMKLNYFEIDGQSYYEAIIWDKTGNTQLLAEYYTTKNEAKRAVRNFVKNYKGTKAIVPENCFVRLFDEQGCAIEDYEVN